ncbi:putative UDP-3-O-acyl-N-acetylglucosamine deacetylase 1, mitochondrial [Nicotiana tabacum]|uniref:UDP-3-O-acyl-N-acetylglucosamine deacetylase n=2 Tax=Nicotiana tabacum TaxID=4097 RepID=A0A1S3Z232_TOBAC|nr:probable UDP-3-O-acyl-N-acetylglucosamine deacetylase 1, mitochondrial [Nicotiana tomentosiformis]XP_016458526.1 PREDICTED: probable UDP-3-O-acyl-N-acetylglucosamine deacetylase 2 [Nicotiana tabacum]
MTFVRNSSTLISWISTGKLQQTVANCVEVTGIGLHSGKVSTVRICPELAGEGRYFELGSKVIQASIDFAKESPLCTTLCKDGHSISTVEHLLSALEATGVDNCRLEVETSDPSSFEVPILDGSAREWVEAIEEAGLKAALDRSGKSCEKLAPVLTEPVTAWRNDSFIAAFPYSKVKITYGIDFLQAPEIGCQWFSSTCPDKDFFSKELASARTFCIYEQVEQLRKSGLIKGGSTENAIVCSESRGWLNPPLRYSDEPCRHKVLDLMGDLSLLAQGGNQGLPVAHIIVYKGGHALHTDFARCLSRVK